MAKPELIEYIKKQLANGHDTTTIREHLLKHGYTELAADEGLQSAHAPPLKRMKHSLFSGKAIAFIAVMLLVVFGLGLRSFYTSDLAGAAHEAAQKNQDGEQPPEIPEPIEKNVMVEEIPETSPSIEDTLQIQEEISEPEQTIVPECTSNNACTAGFACYEKKCMVDNDRDGAADVWEIQVGTDTHNQDSDDDSYFDWDEFTANTHALDPNDPGYTSCKKNTDCTTGQGCSLSGICVTCDDSDNGKEYKRQGTIRGVQYVTTNIVLSTDSCYNGMLIEYYCREGYSYFEQIYCADGYLCNNGRCEKG